MGLHISLELHLYLCTGLLSQSVCDTCPADWNCVSDSFLKLLGRGAEKMPGIWKLALRETGGPGLKIGLSVSGVGGTL